MMMHSMESRRRVASCPSHNDGPSVDFLCVDFHQGRGGAAAPGGKDVASAARVLRDGSEDALGRRLVLRDADVRVSLFKRTKFKIKRKLENTRVQAEMNRPDCQTDSASAC